MNRRQNVCTVKTGQQQYCNKWRSAGKFSLTKDYAELIQSRQVVETVIAQLNLDLTYEEFLNKITVTTQNDTRILSITVKDEDPYVASQMADAIRVAASDHIQNVMNTEAVNVVDEANIPDEPVSPSIKKTG